MVAPRFQSSSLSSARWREDAAATDTIRCSELLATSFDEMVLLDADSGMVPK